jgi:hypothetical protein
LCTATHVIDTAEINLTPLKSQTDFTSPFSSFKGKIQRKSFSVSAVSMTPTLATFEAIISANTMPYAKRF